MPSFVPYIIKVGDGHPPKSKVIFCETFLLIRKICSFQILPHFKVHIRFTGKMCSLLWIHVAFQRVVSCKSVSMYVSLTSTVYNFADFAQSDNMAKEKILPPEGYEPGTPGYESICC